MTILGMAGWFLLGAVAWSMRGQARVRTTTLRPPAISEERERSDDARSWCAAIETITGGRAWLLDEGLRLVPGGEHLMDVAPHDASAGLLNGVRRARETGNASCAILWEGKRANAGIVAMRDARVLVCVTTEAP